MIEILSQDYFSVFGLPVQYSLMLSQLKGNYLELQKKVHPDNFVKADPAEAKLSVTVAARVNEAYRTLNCPLQRAIYLLSLKGIDIASESDTQMDIEFLEQQMELREFLEELPHAQEPELAAEELKETIHSAISDCEKMIEQFVDSNVALARNTVRQWQFYSKLLQEVEALSCQY